MKKFVVRYISKTHAAIRNRKEQQEKPVPQWNFVFGNRSEFVLVSDHTQYESGIDLHQGLKMIAYVEARSKEEAVNTASSRCELLLNLITFVTQTSSAGAKLMDIIEIRDNEPFPYESTSYPEDKTLASAIHKVDQEIFTAVYEAFMAEQTGRSRILRALSWLRKGINEKDPVDEFVSYWIGIEILTTLLRDKKSLSVKNIGYWESIESIFIEKLNINNFSEIKTGRDQLLHGFVELSSDFVLKIHSFRENVRKALIYSISELLNLPGSVTTKITQTPILKSGNSVRIVSKGFLTGIPKEIKALIAEFPHLETKHTASSYAVDDAGKLIQRTSTSHTHTGNKDTKWTIESVEIHGDEDSGIEAASMENII